MPAEKRSSLCVWNLRITCEEQRMGVLKSTEGCSAWSHHRNPEKLFSKTVSL